MKMIVTIYIKSPFEIILEKGNTSLLDIIAYIRTIKIHSAKV